MIGIFDSGVGGLSVLKKLREREPHADALYFGDLENAPYGNKTHEELLALTASAIEVLLDHDIKQIVSACNSVSRSIAEVTRERFKKDFDFIEMSLPTIEAFRGSNQTVLVVGTKATIDSSVYQSGFRDIGILSEGLAIPDLARAIEEGTDDALIDTILSRAFTGISFEKYTTVLLACTHYSLVSERFTRMLPKHITLFDPAVPVSDEIAKRFHVNGSGLTRFLLSKDSQVFRTMVNNMIHREVVIECIATHT